MRRASTPGTTTGTGFARCPSIHSKGSGRSCVRGSAPTGESPRRACLSSVPGILRVRSQRPGSWQEAVGGPDRTVAGTTLQSILSPTEYPPTAPHEPQIDRVCSDLRGQVQQFKRGGGNPISIGIVGINHAAEYTSFEGAREFPTDGRRYKHPAQEASTALSRLQRDAEPDYDFVLYLHFEATNVDPFPFKWIDPQNTLADYAAILTRVSREYDRRF